MKVLSLLLPVLLASPLAIFGADKASTSKEPEKLPPAREIIDKFVQASGGKEHWLKHTSQRSLGKFSLPSQGINGEMEVFAAKPEKLLIKLKLPGLGEVLSGYDGKTGFSVDPATGPRVLDGKELQQLRDQADFYSLLHEAKNFKSMETVGSETFEGQECYKVKLVRVTGDESTEFYDKKSGYLVGTISSQASPLGVVEVTSTASDYKKFADVVLAAKVVQKMGGFAQAMTMETVEFDNVPASAFDLPASIKGLLSDLKPAK